MICCSRDGAQLIFFDAKLHDDTSFFSYLELVHYFLDAALGSRITQQNGITVVMDMAGARWKQFEARMLIKFVESLEDHYPAKLHRVLVLSSPFWVAVLAKTITPLIKSKLSSKLFFIETKGAVFSYIFFLFFSFSSPLCYPQTWISTLRRRACQRRLEENSSMTMRSGCASGCAWSPR